MFRGADSMSNEMWGALGLGVILVVLLGFWLFHVLCLALSAKIVSLPNRTFLKACGCSLLIGVACLIVNIICSVALGPVGVVLSLLIGFFLSAAIIAGIYRAGYGAGLGVAVISWVLSFILAIGATLVIVVGIGLVSTLGSDINGKFQDVARQVQSGR